MRIDEAFKATTDITVDFGAGVVLNVTYRRSATTFNELSRLLEVAKDAANAAESAESAETEASQLEKTVKRMNDAEAAIIGEIINSVTAWDLEDTEGVVIPLTRDALMDIPTEIMVKVIAAIKDSQKATGGK